MTRDEVIDTVLSRAVRPGNTSHLVPLVREFNLIQTQKLERGYPKPWFLLDVAAATVDVTGWKAPTPTQFIELYEEGPAVLLVSDDNSTLLPLERAGRAELEGSYVAPNSKALVDVMEGYLIFSQQLSAGSKLRLLFYGAEPVNALAYGTEGQPGINRWLQYASDLIIAELGHLYCRSYTRDKEGVASFEVDLALASRRLMQENTGRKEAARERFLNGAMYPILGPARTMTTLGNVSDPVGFSTKVYNTEFTKGDTWTRSIIYSIDGVNVNLTGYSAKLQVKASYAGAALLTLTSPASGITLNSNGNITMTISAAQSTALGVGVFVYDLQLTAPDTTVATIMAGTMTVKAEVTT